MNKEWERVSLEDLITLERRPVQVEANSQYREIGVYCFGRGIFHKEPRSGLEVGDKSLFLIREHDFILQVTFAWEGAVALASCAEDGLFGSVRFLTFRVDEKRCVPQFLVTYFRTPEGREQLVRISPGSAGRNRVLSMKRIPEVRIPLPPIPEQRRIVAKVEELTAKIDEARGLKSVTADESRNFWKVLSRIARDTSAVKRSLSDLADFLDGKRVPLSKPEREKRKGSYPYYGASGIIDYLDDFLFDEDLVLLSEDGANLINRSTPIAFIARGQYWVNNHAHVLRPKTEIVDMRFLEYALSDYDVSEFNFASAQAKLNQKNAMKIAFPVPSLSEQRHIVAYLDNLQAKVDCLKAMQAQTQAELDALLPSILDKAFKGEL